MIKEANGPSVPSLEAQLVVMQPSDPGYYQLKSQVNTQQNLQASLTRSPKQAALRTTHRHVDPPRGRYGPKRLPRETFVITRTNTGPYEPKGFKRVFVDR